ncbi:beta-ketoacyl synthase N-terminal-like domain-containing protein [Virgibacillus flavescens]|uniref:beta-ketoacyl synthase N-terminal-like domain-containing protein n=1 Tax=Virgibacillus flavescens TaxID=1611422 RepID=UPI003D33C40A
MDKIAVTGYGIKAPGVSNSIDYKHVLENGTCTSEIIHEDGLNGKSIVGGRIADSFTTINGKNYKRYSRVSRMAIAAVNEAVEMAELRGVDPAKIAVIMGTSVGGLLEIEHYADQSHIYKTFPLHGITLADSHTLSSSIAYHLGTNGPSYTLSTGCASSSDAILLGKLLLESGQADVCIVGGSDSAISQWSIFGFSKLRLIETGQKIHETGVPFSKKHKGFVMAEGSGILVLERASHATNRGVPIKGHIDNGFANNKPAPLLQSSSSEHSMIAAMKHVLGDKKPTYVNSQALGIADNDEVERKVHNHLFGSSVPITSIKGSIGHTFGSIGAMQAISSLISMEYGFIPPTLKTAGDGFEELPIVFQTEYSPVESVAITTHGNGGNNTCLFITKQ